MTYFDPYTSFSETHQHNHGGSHIKHGSSASPSDMVYETNQLVIQSPSSSSHNIVSNNDSLLPQQHPQKRFYYEDDHHPWSVDYLCTESSSPLANAPLDSIFGFQTFQLLSVSEQDQLARLLPCDGSSGSSNNNNNQQQQQQPQPQPQQHHLVQPSFFSKDENPAFWDSLHDWQSMLANTDFSSDNSSSTHSSHTTTTITNHPPPFPLVPCTTTANNITSNTSPSSMMPINSSNVHPQHSDLSEMNPMLGVGFKDEAFDTYWGDRDKMHNVAGDSKNITLKDMCRKGLIREYDVIVYKRNFSACKVAVSKSMRVVKANGTTGISIELDNEIYEDFETPTALETKILDRHGKITKDKRPNGNAFKSIRLIREGKDLGRLFDIRKDCFGGAN